MLLERAVINAGPLVGLSMAGPEARGLFPLGRCD